MPLFINLALAPQDRPKGPVPQNSGGDTHSQTPTIIGRTVPGALIFTGTGPTDLKLAGPVFVANAQGEFSDTVTLTNGINQEDFQVVDRYGQQLLRGIRFTGSILDSMKRLIRGMIEPI